MKRWLALVVVPAIQANGSRLINGLTFEKGQANWTALTTSNRWSSWT
jgi:hypothetical protein